MPRGAASREQGGLKDLELGVRERIDVPFFTKAQAVQIVEMAAEPFAQFLLSRGTPACGRVKFLPSRWTIYLSRRKQFRVNKSADDSNPHYPRAENKASVAVLPMPSTLETVLRNYLTNHWKSNPNRNSVSRPTGTRSRKRENVVVYGCTRY